MKPIPIAATDTLARDLIEAGARAIAWDDLTPYGRETCDWHRDFSELDRKKCRCQSGAALLAALTLLIERGPSAAMVLAMYEAWDSFGEDPIMGPKEAVAIGRAMLAVLKGEIEQP